MDEEVSPVPDPIPDPVPDPVLPFNKIRLLPEITIAGELKAESMSRVGQWARSLKYTGDNSVSSAGGALIVLSGVHGGYPDACLGVHDIIRCMAKVVPIYLLVEGMLYGAAPVILTAVPIEYRFAYLNTTFSLQLAEKDAGLRVTRLQRGPTSRRIIRLYELGTKLTPDTYDLYEGRELDADFAQAIGLIGTIL